MSLKLNEALGFLIEQLSKDDMPDQQLQQDAAEISTKLNEELSNINSIFKGTVGDWNQSYSNVLKTQGFVKSNMLGNVEKLTIILNGYLPPQITKIIYGPVDWRPVNNLDDALLLVIKRTIPFMENPEQLSSAYEKLMQFKQSDTVSMKEIRALFGLH
ncbi:uncharacterized protein [Drosophila takahashii]|uniref:uncharacterized protein isoform X2 n=1 Tax=Drosophila takahashii TaxID=29030 RepID=UPI003898DA62